MGDIAILFSDAAERQRIAQRLTGEHTVSFELPESAAAGCAARVAAVVCDRDSLAAAARRIALERGRCAPGALPVLLVSDRRGIAALDSDLWRIVDEAVVVPLDPLDVVERVESLLRRSERLQRFVVEATFDNHEQRLARRVQEAALPRLLPRVPGLTFGAFYRAGTDRGRLGGDWYDALLLADGRVLLSIGDVCGSGLEAAVAMAVVRHVFRGTAQINPDPAVILDAADRMLHAEQNERQVTAFVGIFDPVTRLLTYASAGHPPPLLRRADDSVTELAATGAPLGIPFALERSVESTTMPLGSLLVLYTDGLTESTRDPVAGEAHLRRALCDAAVRSAPNVAAALHDRVVSGVSPDDVAILTVAHIEREPAADRLFHWSFDASDASGARRVRDQIGGELRSAGVSDAAIANAELVFSELVGNVVRYAAEWVDVALDTSSACPVLHILDGGPGFRYLPRLPLDLHSERGRGLFIVGQLTDEFHVTKRPYGGSHARAVLSRG